MNFNFADFIYIYSLVSVTTNIFIIFSFQIDQPTVYIFSVLGYKKYKEQNIKINKNEKRGVI